MRVAKVYVGILRVEMRGTTLVYGSTELTLPDDSTHPPDSVFTSLRWWHGLPLCQF